MDKRKIGRSDLAVPPLVLGGNVFGWVADRETSFALLDTYVDAGFTAVDTADAYSRWVPGHVGGESETVIGEWLRVRRCRHRIVLATKVGVAAPRTNVEKSSRYDLDLSEARIVTGVEASLRRLKTDYIDLYQSHGDDPNTPLYETLEAYAKLIESGKVRTIGASNHSADRFTEALRVSHEHNWPRYECLQPLYNLYDRAGFEDAILPICIEHEVGVICLSSLAKGFLTGKYRGVHEIAKSQWAERLKGYQTGRGKRILTALKQVAEEHNATSGQVALAWLISQPGVSAPIVAADNLQQLREIMGAVRLALTEQQRGFLSAASTP